MTKELSTREKLLLHGRRLFWLRGYSNVGLREIAKAAGVDVALVSRNFGSKRGLFEATLDGAYGDLDLPPSADELIERMVRIFVEAPRGGPEPSVVQMLLMNAHDDEVGDLVRRYHADAVQTRIEQVVGDKRKAAQLMAALLGFSVAEKSLLLDGIDRVGTPEYETQFRRFLKASIAD